MKDIRKSTLAALALLVSSMIICCSTALAQFAGPQQLTLINGWIGSPFGTSIPTVELVGNIVQLRGAIATAGTNPEAFVLPAPLRPAVNVYVPVDLCNATKGRLYIQPSGAVSVQAEGETFSNAQCFTSLDGASFALSTTGAAGLTLINGWTNTIYGTGNAAVRKLGGIVHFQGAISTSGTNAQPFVLPPYYSPSTDVYIPVDMCGATNGRLWIQPNGVVTVEAETAFSNAQCFTSLDGAYFVAQGNPGFQALQLINGWKGAPFGTYPAAAGGAYGLVVFKGGISSGTSPTPFNLPPSFTPVTTVYVPVDLCNATKGRLMIETSGAVTIEAENENFANAQCFTSLDGVSFVQ
jgi:hypothetical protein